MGKNDTDTVDEELQAELAKLDADPGDESDEEVEPQSEEELSVRRHDIEVVEFVGLRNMDIHDGSGERVSIRKEKVAKARFDSEQFDKIVAAGIVKAVE